MSKKQHGNKEAKKPKQAPRLTPPPTGGPAAGTGNGWPRPPQDRK